MLGYATCTTINNCSTNVTLVTNILGSEFGIGGFVGRVTGVQTHNNCLAVCSITINETAFNSGGIGGYAGRTLGGSAMAFNYCKAETTINVSGNQTGTSPKIGGFIGGYLTGASPAMTIKYCIATGVIYVGGTGDYIMGGFVGSMAGSSSIEECMADVTIDAPNATAVGVLYAGGFFGSGTAPSDSIAKGDIMLLGCAATTANVRIGGFAGQSSAGNATQCYSIGKVLQHPTGYWGGFAAWASGPSGGTDCFWDTETSDTTIGVGNLASPTGVTGHTTEDMKLEATFTNWDFDAVWEIAEFVQPAVPQANLTVWLSKTGDYHNFDEGLDDDDSFSLVLPTTNEIRWMEGLESLIVGTSAGEWKIASNKLDTPLSPTAYSAKRQTTHGSRRIKALAVNSSILFVDYVGRKLREVTFTPAEEKYVAPDMTELAEHITTSGIVDMAHQKNPDSIVWCVLANGKMLAMAYDRDQDVVAWSEIITDGTFLSVCVVPGDDEDSVWVTVTRDNGTYVERFAPRVFGTDISDAFFVDGGITATPAGQTVSGLDHLEGQEVIVMGDGVEQTEETAGDFTVTSGNITVPAGLTEVHVGLPSTWALQPMRIVLGDRGGTSFGSITRVNEIIVSFLNTLGAKYGDSLTNQFDINFDDPRWEDEAYITGLFSGDVVATMPGGFSVNNPIVLSGSGVYPATVRLMIAKIDKTGR
jgi:hypothetical protein